MATFRFATLGNNKKFSPHLGWDELWLLKLGLAFQLGAWKVLWALLYIHDSGINSTWSALALYVWDESYHYLQCCLIGHNVVCHCDNNTALSSLKRQEQ